MIRRLLPFVTLMLLFVALAIASPAFLTKGNLTALVQQTAVINIMALGMTLIIITGGIDLSVGAILALAGYLGVTVMVESGSIALGVATGLGVGMVAGALNGFLVTQLKISPFIVTLGMMGVIRGGVLTISRGLPSDQVPKDFQYLGVGTPLGLPAVFWVLLACAVVMHFVMEHTRLGRSAFAIGSNPDAAFYAGLPVALHLTCVYGINGVLTGIAALIETARLTTGQPTAGQNYELQAIAAVVIGGGSLRGGEGSVAGTLIGAFIMGLLSNGSDLLGINNYLQQMIIGGAIIVAVTIDEFRKRRTITA
jgi:ribose/xylose/arabinose/galactoside ABC-type transport system permease subunit